MLTKRAVLFGGFFALSACSQNPTILRFRLQPGDQTAELEHAFVEQTLRSVYALEMDLDRKLTFEEESAIWNNAVSEFKALLSDN